eukprot:4633112-Amphidinium_carterae.2
MAKDWFAASALNAVFSAMAWVRNEFDREQKGVMNTFCDWRNADTDAVLRLQKEKDPYMNQ